MTVGSKEIFNFTLLYKMFPFLSVAIIIVFYGALTWKSSERPSILGWITRLFLAIVIGLAIGSIDFFIGLGNGTVDDPSKYLEWQFPQYTLGCMALTLLLVVAFQAGSSNIGWFTSLITASALGYWLNASGLLWALSAMVGLGYYSFGDFVENLTSFDRVTEAYFLQGLPIYLVASAIFVHIILRGGKFGTANSLFRTYQEVTVRFKSSSNEPARLLMGMAAAGRLPFVEQLRKEQEHPCQATPFSMDVDRKKLIELADEREATSFTNRVWYFCLAVAALVLIGLELFAAVLFPIIIAGIVVFRQRLHDRKALVADYQPSKFEPPEAPDAGIHAQNLVTYAGFDPFEQFGVRFGSWVLMVDTKRAKPDDLSGGTTTDPEIKKIEQAIMTSMAHAGQIVSVPKPLYFVQGANIPEDIKREGAISPPQNLYDDRFVKHADDPNSPVRRYLWIQKSMWGREITISYFVRLFRQGDDLNLEINGIVMPPVSAQYRWVDQIAPRGVWAAIFDFMGALVIGAVMLIWTPLFVLGKIQEGIAEALGSTERARRRTLKSIERTANFDFGAPLSVRRRVADFRPVQYFQQMDRRAAEATFAGRVMRSFIDYLDECNIDTSELREQRTTLLNQGIVVQGGDVKADNLAVGAGAKVKSVGQRARSTLGGSK